MFSLYCLSAIPCLVLLTSPLLRPMDGQTIFNMGAFSVFNSYHKKSIMDLVRML